MANDPYVDPRTGTLRNLLGITDSRVLAQAEARLAAAAELVLFHEHLPLGRYDLAHLRAIHRHLFGVVYDWAGQLRTVNIAKGDTTFALVEWLEPQANQIFARLSDQQLLQGLPRPADPVAVQRHLGHRDVTTTLNIYAGLFPNRLDEIVTALDAIHERAAGSARALTSVRVLQTMADFDDPVPYGLVLDLEEAWRVLAALEDALSELEGLGAVPGLRDELATVIRIIHGRLGLSEGGLG